MLKRIAKLFKSMSITATATPLHNPLSNTTQEDTRSRETRKRVRKAFEDQAQQIQMMALKQHSCQNPMECRTEKCFVWEPDKVHDKPYSISPTKQMKERKKAQAKRSYYSEN